MLVALDTSTKYASIALYDGQAVVGELNWLSGVQHTVQLLPNLERLLSLRQLDVGSLRAVAVALGPGSFTGLRVAVSLAKGLCLARGLPFVGVGTLAATAYAQALVCKQVCALIDAGRGQLHGALYPAGEQTWRPEGSSGILPLADLLGLVREPTLFCGEAASQAALIRERLGKLAVIAPPAASVRRAGYLAELAWRRYEAKDFDDLATVQPLYLSRPAVPPPRGKSSWSLEQRLHGPGSGGH
ncbi:MAG: tRNA (adenosine(37)-N6)-threonylcarbamoyltransferase complex dimerization subunit type 1 TsaB [Dehalococcoidales bacterium]|nr:tRNA (adenosine(37)-N6)-threonylcarbamoyltransferase complex dimerization subunit type 1 TsaB [Dehalococcoidales bacterium]